MCCINELYERGRGDSNCGVFIPRLMGSLNLVVGVGQAIIGMGGEEVELGQT